MKEDGQFAKFYKVFLNEVYPHFGRIEHAREEFLKEQRTGILLVLIILLFIIFLTLPLSISFFSDFDYAWLFLLFFLPSLVLVIIFSFKRAYKKKFKEYLKEELLAKLLKVFGKIERKDYNVAFAKEDDNAVSHLYNLLLCDDAFEGEYNDIRFKFAEFVKNPSYEIEKEYDDANYAQKGTLVILFDFNKKIVSPVEIISKSEVVFNILVNFVCSVLSIIIALFITYLIFMNNSNNYFELYFVFIFVYVPMVYIIYKKYLKKPTKDLYKYFGDKNNLVTLEDPKFNKRFSVYSTDQVEARYLCTTAFMDRLYNLKTAYGADRLKCSFYNDCDNKPKIMITVHTKKDLFELGDINKPIHKDTTIYEFYREINSIYQIIDALKLDRKTGM